MDMTPGNLTEFFERGPQTRQQFAEALGISQPYLSMIENGKRRIPLTLAVQIRDLTGVPIESLLPAPEQAAS